MDPQRRKIEVFAPFSAAFDLTKTILFQPFDLTKWLTIGFAAFLAGLADAMRINPGFQVPDFNGRWQPQSDQLEAAGSQLSYWVVVPIIAVLVLIGLGVMVLLMWLGARGRFMFIDCIVHNRGAIEAPWREYRREGNRLFLWSLAIAGVSLVVLAICALPLLVPYLTGGEFAEFGLLMTIYLAVVVALFVVAGIALSLVTWFMAAVMYRQRCSAGAAFMTVVRLIAGDAGPFILYVLLALVTLVGAGMLTCVAACFTCCMAALPYVGTVILLPVHVFYYAYGLLFLRQFGPEYDVWASAAAFPQASSPDIPPPPAAEPPATSRPQTDPPPLAS